MTSVGMVTIRCMILMLVYSRSVCNGLIATACADDSVRIFREVITVQ